MINDDKYNEVLENGLLLDHYFLLCNMKNGREIIKNKRVQGFINLLTKKEYIKDDVLTQKALDLIDECGFSVTEPVEEMVSVNIDSWLQELHGKCVNKIEKYTGAKQVRGKIGKTSYSFLQNPKDMASRLMKVISVYRLKDLEKIEETIMKHIDRCHAASNWFPIMKYYIMKDGGSDMVTDMEDIDEGSEKKEKSQFEIVESKKLF